MTPDKCHSLINLIQLCIKQDKGEAQMSEVVACAEQLFLNKEQRVLRLVSCNPLTCSDISLDLGITPQATSNHLKRLKRKGLIETVGKPHAKPKWKTTNAFSGTPWQGMEAFL